MSISDFREGDILFVRSGYIHQYEVISPQRRKELHESSWNPFENTRVAAVAGGTRSFEEWPCMAQQWHLHEKLLVPGGVASPPNALAFF
ncbi:hypothetical protein COCCADRAFT_42248 [Bipolaris zeicola 26-R-13]|uniref:Uncharacterized protein n=1 Tax=Cochliobolus carbonum (strain 26-R-13) TaxID=930089 RepID=W6XVG7_COCC2|nr:uncharacterized protein COCCADRAFT_42248 [Bipolaris zeicola 26-R-13]EUC26769.1 hypothetical protein COCCADRAFT_42248 [Bipolaris zeicola 26-R-13]